MADLSDIDTIVVVLMENRSFDHMLGYLSLPPYSRADLDGLKSDPAWLQQVANLHFGSTYSPFHLTDKRLPDDPPHERNFITLQMGAPIDGVFPLKGFVSSYA